MRNFTCIILLLISGISAQAFSILSEDSNVNLETDVLPAVPDEEKQALIDLYNATGGANWINNTNWLSDAPVSEWYGIAVEDEHVVGVRLNSNNLVGTLPESINELDRVTYFYAGSNMLSGVLLDMSALTSLADLYLSYNNYSFVDLVPNYESLSEISRLQLSPQKSTGADELIEGIMGETYTFKASEVDGEQVDYQWYILKKGFSYENTNEIIPNETSTELILSNITEDDLDTYICVATSESIPGFEIWSPTFELTGSVSETEKLALIAVYNATNGDDWINNTNWLTEEPIRNWYGVEVSGNKVVEVDLSFNNLTGSLPSEIGDLEYLEFLSFWSNAIEGTLPTEIGNLTELRVVSFEENNFAGEIPESFENLTKLNGFWLYGNQLTGNVPEYFRNLENLIYLDFAQNSFYGKLPDFSTLPKLLYLNISNNFFLASDFADQFEYYLTLERSWNTSYYYSPQRTRTEPVYKEILIGSDVTLSVPGTESSRRAETYQWFKDGVSIAGAVNNTYIISNAQYSDSGDYSYELYDTEIENYVLEGEITTVEVKETLGVEEFLDQSISFYPNPVSSNILKIQNNSSAQITHINFYNLLGKSIKQVNKPEASINLTGLSAGIYIIKVKTDQGEISKKLMKL